MSNDPSESGAETDTALVTTVGHRIRYAIFRLLTERPASAKELADLLPHPRSTIGDHLRNLIANGLIESAGEKARRGTTERFYRVAPSARWLDDAVTGQLDPRQKRKTAVRVAREAATDTFSALESDLLDHRDDWCVGSSRVAVDSQGWKELAEIHRRTLEEVERVRDESAGRLVGKAEERLRAISWVMLLEMPES